MILSINVNIVKRIIKKLSLSIRYIVTWLNFLRFGGAHGGAHGYDLHVNRIEKYLNDS